MQEKGKTFARINNYMGCGCNKTKKTTEQKTTPIVKRSKTRRQIVFDKVKNKYVYLDEIQKELGVEPPKN